MRSWWWGLALVGAAAPAWAWVDTPPGSSDWPMTRGSWGMQAMQGRWLVQCGDPGWQTAAEITIDRENYDYHSFRYQNNSAGLPTQYRVIETTPYKVTLAVRGPAVGRDGTEDRFWVLRYLNSPFLDRIGVHECVPSPLAMTSYRWDFTLPELRTFWAGFAGCNPELTARDPGRQDDEGYAYWGEGWHQACDFIRHP